MVLPCFDSTVLLPRASGRSFRPQTWTIRRWPDDLQLHPDQPVPHLSAALSASLSRWLEGEGHAGGDAVRARLRTSLGSLLSPRRSRSSSVCRVVCVSKPELALFQPGLLGSHAPARNHAVNSLLPRQSRPGPPASTESASQIRPAHRQEERLRRLH